MVGGIWLGIFLGSAAALDGAAWQRRRGSVGVAASAWQNPCHFGKESNATSLATVLGKQRAWQQVKFQDLAFPCACR